MTKRVILRFDGVLEQGFQVSLEIGEAGAPSVIEADGTLPPAPALGASLEQWQQIYCRMAQPTRIHLKQITVKLGLSSQLETCRRSAKELQQHLQHWLESPSFHPIDRQLRESLSIQEPIQVLIRSRDRRLHSLPWHLWEFFEHYSQAEMAVSAPVGPIHPIAATVAPADKVATVRVLAILGDRRGIDTDADRQFLQDLPQAAVVFLVEPSRQDITEHLWDQKWDIFFFAGHSQTEGHQGRLHINPGDSLTIEELKYGLRTAIDRGLQLAIFNSCDGLGLADELAPLHLPQLLVMRQPVPDPVAQSFIKQFLIAFAQGATLYQAVRSARERLQGLEEHYPCATWLPVIFQNPAAVPPTWNSLLSGESAVVESEAAPAAKLAPTEAPNRSHSKISLALRALLPLCLTSLVATSIVLSARYSGLLQAIELAAFDQLLRHRPSEPPDPRLLAVLITDEDVQAQPAAQRRGSLSDPALAQLLQTLEAHQPQVIGLDIYRDYPVGQNYPQLVQQLQQRDRLVAVCKVGEIEKSDQGIAPPPELPAPQSAFSDLVVDADYVVRRHLLAMTPAPASRCVASYALSVQLALRYLAPKGIRLQYVNPDIWRLGKLRFQPLKAHTGGYHRLDDRGHQILLNYRSSGSPDRGIRQVTLGQVLKGEVSRDAIHNRIVLIGTIAEGTHDTWLTPYQTPQGDRRAIPGVILQAQMTSQLLSAALDDRLLLESWPWWTEMLWVAGWAGLGGLLALYSHRPTYLGLMLLGAIAALVGSCLLLLIQISVWAPLVPSGFALIISGIAIKTVGAQRIQGRD